MHALTVTSRPKLYIFNVTLTLYLLNDSLMSRPDLIYGRIGRPTCLASPQRDFKWNPTDRLLMAGTRSNAGAVKGIHPWSPALWCRCNASTARAVVFKLSLKNKVYLTLWKNNTGIEWYPGTRVSAGYPGNGYWNGYPVIRVPVPSTNLDCLPRPTAATGFDNFGIRLLSK